MYCPRCALQNSDSGKFCRACGTELQVVALALAAQEAAASRQKDSAEKPNPTGNLVRKRTRGARNTVQGGILLGASLLIGAAMALFSNEPDWMLVWAAFFGWMACWGIVVLATGIGAIIEARTLLRQIQVLENASNPPKGQWLFTEDQGEPAHPTPLMPAPISVTDRTTKRIGDRLSSQ